MGRRTRVASAVALAVTILGACTATPRESEGPDLGEVEVERVTGPVAALDCATVADGLFARALVTTGDDDATSTLDLSDEQGTVTATLALEEASGAQTRYVGTDLTRTGEPDELAVEGAFDVFEDGRRSGSVEGSLDLSCPGDLDPGGGSLTLGGRQIAYDLVSCVESPERFEVRARDLGGTQGLTLRRARSGDRWVDRIETNGDVEVSERVTIDSDESTGVDVADGLFDVLGDRVRVTSEAFPGEVAGSADLTCGIDVER